VAPAPADEADQREAGSEKRERGRQGDNHVRGVDAGSLISRSTEGSAYPPDFDGVIQTGGAGLEPTDRRDRMRLKSSAGMTHIEGLARGMRRPDTRMTGQRAVRNAKLA
jgi:hypothetical protein